MEKSEKKQEEGLLGFLHDFVYLLAIILVLFQLVFRVVIVSGSSMNQTLVDGDYLLLLSNTFYHSPKQGDVVVVSKQSFDDGKDIVKRVIATQGQTVDIDFEAGIVYVDGVPLDEPYTNTPTNLQEGMVFPLTVEDNCLFVMGDNRNNSKDSRNPQIGQVDTREVLGKVLLLVFPGTDYGSAQRNFTRIGGVA